MLTVRLDSGGHDVILEQLDIPAPGFDEVIVRVAYAGVCQSDLHFLAGARPADMPSRVTLGHEISGVVHATGDPVASWEQGQHVVIHPADVVNDVPAGIGVQRDGGWAEYVAVPSRLLVALDPSIPLDQAAIIPDAVATPWAAITSTAHVCAGESVVLWGAGGLGHHAVKLLRLVGAVPIVAIDPSPTARARALRAGADSALDPGAPDFDAELASHGPFDVAFDFFGSPAIQQQAVDAVRRRGRVILVGIPAAPLSIDSSPQFIRHEKRVIGHYAAQRHHVEEVVHLVRHGRLDLSDSISGVYPLSSAQQAIDDLRSRVGEPIRFVLRADHH